MSDTPSLQDQIPQVEAIMASHEVRAFDAMVVTDSFGVEMIAIRGHLNDFRNADIDELFRDLRVALTANVALENESFNRILIRPLPQKRAGTIEYRFDWLMAELEKRFPEGTEHRMFCAEPPEAHMMREIDATLEKLRDVGHT